MRARLLANCATKICFITTALQAYSITSMKNTFPRGVTVPVKANDGSRPATDQLTGSAGEKVVEY